MNPYGVPECPRCQLFVPHSREVCDEEVSDRRARVTIVVIGLGMCAAVVVAFLGVVLG